MSRFFSTFQPFCDFTNEIFFLGFLVVLPHKWKIDPVSLRHSNIECKRRINQNSNGIPWSSVREIYFPESSDERQRQDNDSLGRAGHESSESAKCSDKYKYGGMSVSRLHWKNSSSCLAFSL